MPQSPKRPRKPVSQYTVRSRIPSATPRRRADWYHDLPPGTYDVLFSAQRGVCAICGAPPLSRKLDVDHDHTTEVVRGLLCSNCNRGLGYLKDNIEVLAKAISYLASPRFNLKRGPNAIKA